VPTYLAPDWVAAWADAVRAAGPQLLEAAGGEELSLTVEVVDDDGTEPVRYHLQLADGRVDAGPGPARPTRLTFRQDRTTAARVARGELNAQQAFLAGGLEVHGDVRLLVRCQEVFRALDDAVEPVRAATVWP